MNLEDPEYWKSLVNMSLTRFFVLRMLHENPTHGYAILDDLRVFTEGCCTPAYGTIYPILKELQEGGYAESRMDNESGRNRKVYQLTDRGELAYQQAVKTWQEVMPILQKIVNFPCEDCHD
ncbi:MAG: PadR family transcriptional regulator [Anaerolineaceae bacterium]